MDVLVRVHLVALVNMAIALVAAFVAGLLFQSLRMPAPYLLGAPVGVWIVARAIRVFTRDVAGFDQINLQIPVVVRIAVMVCLGTMIGSLFTPGFLTIILEYWPTIFFLIILTIAITVLGAWYLIRWRKFSPLASILCCLPGGQGEIMLAMRGRIRDEHVVALFHLIRVAAVFALTPLLLSFFSDGVVSQSIVSARSAIVELENVVLLGVFGGFGFGVARLLRIPSPYILGPMIFSLFLHTTGWIQLQRSGWFLLIAQLVIGGGVGARLAEVPLSEILAHVGEALMLLLITILLVVGFAWIMTIAFPESSFMRQFLAYIPGGMYEVTLLALVYGYEMAFVAFHHSVRVILMFSFLPGIIWFFDDRSSPKDSHAGIKDSRDDFRVS